MLGANVLMIEASGFVYRELNDLFGPGGETDLAAGSSLPRDR